MTIASLDTWLPHREQSLLACLYWKLFTVEQQQDGHNIFFLRTSREILVNVNDLNHF